jgi:hypothetical protein
VSGNPGPVVISPLLAAAAELVLSFPRHADVVVSVSRKTDASLWPALFSAIGSPAALLEHLMDQLGAFQSAACALVVVDRLEGPNLAHGLALRLVRASLKKAQYVLCAEILRFIIPPGDPSTAGSANGSKATLAAASAAAAAAAAAGVIGGANTPGVEQSGSSWFGWLWGGTNSSSSSSAPMAAAAAAAGGPEAAAVAGGGGLGGGGLQASDRQSSNVSRDSTSSPWQYRHSTAGSAGNLMRGLSGAGMGQGGRPWEGLSWGQGWTPGLDACQLVAEHGWVLLEQVRNGEVAFLWSGGFLAGF